MFASTVDNVITPDLWCFSSEMQCLHDLKLSVSVTVVRLFQVSGS